MRKIILTTMLMLGIMQVFCQLNGSGKVVTKIYPFTSFDKVYFDDLDGVITVEIGKPFSVSISIDDNLESLLTFSENSKEHALSIGLKGNKNNKLYIENTGINIKISLPEASVIANNGNSNVTVNNIIGRYFRLENNGNGTTTLSGRTDKLDIQKSGNGAVKANKLFVKNAEISSKGNGDILVNVSGEVLAALSGNGDIKNSGKGIYKMKGNISGNGKLISD